VSYRVQADLNGSAVVILVRNAKNALLTMKELAELSYSEILTSDLDGRIVDRAWLEAEERMDGPQRPSPQSTPFRPAKSAAAIKFPLVQPRDRKSR
jgi:hypothetical protein